jgi:hypothetical protein
MNQYHNHFVSMEEYFRIRESSDALLEYVYEL